MLTVAEAQTLARKVWKATLLCFSWKRAAAGLVLLGLILTAFGAAIAASGQSTQPGGYSRPHLGHDVRVRQAFHDGHGFLIADARR